MNFVINVSADAEARDVVCVESMNYGDIHDAELIYREDRADPETGDDFVCLVFRVPK